MPNNPHPARSLAGQPAGPKPSAKPPADVMKVFRQLLVPPGVYIGYARALGEPPGAIPCHRVPSCAILVHAIPRLLTTRTFMLSHRILNGWKGTVPGTSVEDRGLAPITWPLTYSALAYVNQCEHCSRIDHRRCIGTGPARRWRGAQGHCRPRARHARTSRMHARVRSCTNVDRRSDDIAP